MCKLCKSVYICDIKTRIANSLGKNNFRLITKSCLNSLKVIVLNVVRLYPKGFNIPEKIY